MNNSIHYSPVYYKLIWVILAIMVADGLDWAYADQIKANNNTALQSGGSWVGGVAPGAGDNAIWNSRVSNRANCTNTLSSAVTWKGIAITNPSAPVMINGNATLTLNGGINMAGTTVNFTLNASTVNIASNQTWTVAPAYTLTTGSSSSGGTVQNNTVTLSGGGTWTTCGTSDNGSLGVIVSNGTFNMNKASSTSPNVHSVGGPGLTINSGSTARITGTGGDQIYNGAGVTDNGTFDLYGNSEAINGLNGSGTVTTTLSGGTPTLTVGAANTGGSFTGTIQSGASGSITLTESGTGSQSIACITRGSGTAGPFINANAGTLILNGTADNSFASATVTNGGTLLLAKASSSNAHAIGSGLTIDSGGLAQITGTGGDQIYDSDDITVNGTFDLNGNSEAINGLNGSGTVTTTLNGGTPTLTVGAVGDGGTFTGTIQAGTNGSITLVKSGTGGQSIACITRGNGTAGPSVNANGGTLILNGTVDNAYTAVSVGSGATLQLAKASSGTAHAVGSGLTIASGGLVQITGTGGDQIYDGNSLTSSGTFDLNGNSETVGSISFTGGTLQNSSATTATLTDGGTLAMNGNVTVNDPNAVAGTTVILQYSGSRSGTGTFAAGNLPAGAYVVDNTTAQTVSVVNGAATNAFPQLVVPSLNTNEMVVAATTPQQYGAKGDGVTDDSAAFQAAINAVYNSGHSGGGVVYVPAANYVFSNTITIPTGVTLHGNWTDWTTGTSGLVGTTFYVYAGAGQSNGTPFITMSRSAALRDINIWYPNQNPASITPYPYTISATDNNVIQNVVLVNSYQGIQENGAEFLLSTVIGSPLCMGFSTTGGIADICYTEDVRFSPAVWPASQLPNAPAPGSAYATWMRTHGTAWQIFRVDGLISVNTEISGYNVGLDFELNSSGQAGSSFYNGWVTNCATALLAQEMQTAEGLEFSDFTLDSDTAISRTHATNDAAAEFDNCIIIGRTGTSVSCLGADWQSSMSFQNCTISNILDLTGPGVFNLVNCRLLGGTQCVMSASASAAAFTGCTFSPAQNIVNNGAAKSLLIDSRQAISNAMPVFDWTNIMANLATRRPAKPALYVATNYGATGNGTSDDTVAIQNALTAAGQAGGGIVYLPPGTYRVTNTLDVPSGVELRGTYEMRHHTWPAADNIAKGAILWPYGGQGSTNGPPAIALEANAGLVGLTISYESQWTNCFAFPPTIQGRGPNVYMIGIQCPQPYYYVDLDTYTCTNHLLYMVDGWALQTGVHVGNGSSGTMADCHANWTFWIDNFSSPHALAPAYQAPVLGFVMSNLQYYALGNCTESFIKDFSIIENEYMHCSAENGVGPKITGISAMCDATYQCYVFDSTAPCTFNDVNVEWLVSLNLGYSWLPNTAAILTTSNFQGTVRFFNSPLWGSHNSDYIVNGGDVGLELVHLWQYAGQGSQINGGVFHLVNCGAFNDVNNGSSYNVTFGPNSGIAGKTNEVIGSFSYTGWNVNLQNLTNTQNIWMDYAVSNDSVLNVGPLVLGDYSPDGLYQFEPSNALTFLAYSPYGINSGNVSVQLIATNLLGQGYVTNYTTANGLTVSGTTLKSVSLPLPQNATYNAVVQVTDANGNGATNSWSFDTVNPAFTFEAEDFDYNGGSYFANPTPDEYANLAGVSAVDYINGIIGQGGASYRPQGLETEGASDKPRLAYVGFNDYDVGFASGGNWGNYTRSFPSGTYNIFVRAADGGGGNSDSASLSLVTSGQGTTNQATTKLGTFSVPATGSWQTYTWVPLLDNNSNPVVFTGGSIETLRVTTDHGSYNANYYLLVATNTEVPLLVKGKTSPVVSGQPVQLLAAPGANSITLQWPGQSGAAPGSIYYAPSLAAPVQWVLLPNTPTYLNGNWRVTLPVGTNSSGFFKLQ